MDLQPKKWPKFNMVQNRSFLIVRQNVGSWSGHGARTSHMRWNDGYTVGKMLKDVLFHRTPEICFKMCRVCAMKSILVFVSIVGGR